MKLSKTSQLYKFNSRWGNMYEYEYGRSRLTLCKLFWMTLFKVASLFVIGSLMLMFLTIQGVNVCQFFDIIPWEYGFLVGGILYLILGFMGIVLPIGCFFCIIWFCTEAIPRVSKKVCYITPIKSIKNKLCPVIEIVEE